MPKHRDDEDATHAGQIPVEQPTDRRVLVDGFLAFCDRTVVSVPAMPTMVLVGPPGCGKTTMVNDLMAARRAAVQCRVNCPGLCSPIRRMLLDPEPTPRNFEASWAYMYRQELYRPGRLVVDPRRLRLIFVDDADNLANATARAVGIVLARMRQVTEEAGVAFVLVGTGVLEGLLNALPDANARFRVLRYPLGAQVPNAPEATGRPAADSGLADHQGDPAGDPIVLNGGPPLILRPPQ